MLCPMCISIFPNSEAFVFVSVKKVNAGPVKKRAKGTVLTPEMNTGALVAPESVSACVTNIS